MKFDEKRLKTLSKSGLNQTIFSKRTREPIMLVLSVKITAVFRDGRVPMATTMVTYKKYRNGAVRVNAATERGLGFDRYVVDIVDEMLDELQDQEISDAVENTRKLASNE